VKQGIFIGSLLLLTSTTTFASFVCAPYFDIDNARITRVPSSNVCYNSYNGWYADKDHSSNNNSGVSIQFFTPVVKAVIGIWDGVPSKTTIYYTDNTSVTISNTPLPGRPQTNTAPLGKAIANITTRSTYGDMTTYVNMRVYSYVPASTTVDSDADGVNNYNEVRCGTDPFNPNSFFYLDRTQSATNVNQWIMKWPSAPGRLYRLEYSTSAVSSAVFTPLQSNIAGTPPTNTLMVTLPANVRADFCRIVQQSDSIPGKNVAGCLRIAVPANNMVLVTFPFERKDNRIGNILGTQLIGGSSSALSDNIIKWKNSPGVYVTYWKTSTGQWREVGQNVETTNTLTPGEGFWIKNVHTSSQVVYLKGDVPTNATRAVSLKYGQQLVGYSYPSDKAITNTTLALVAKRGSSYSVSDNIQVWDSNAKSYVTYWLPSVTGSSWRRVGQSVNTADKFLAGQGFWYIRRGTGTISWTEAKP
jgi:hypothetical protein